MKKTRIEPSPITSPVARRILRDASQGRPLLTIARDLTTEGVPTPKGAQGWAQNSVQTRLTQNAATASRRNHNPERFLLRCGHVSCGS